MKVLALVYPGMTLLDLVGPLQAWSFLPGYEVQYVWHRTGAVPTDCGLSVHATNSFEDAWIIVRRTEVASFAKRGMTSLRQMVFY